MRSCRTLTAFLYTSISTSVIRLRQAKYLNLRHVFVKRGSESDFDPGTCTYISCLEIPILHDRARTSAREPRFR